MAASGTVLVLGASGFLGRHVVARLRREGRPVVAVSRHGEVPIDLLGCPPGQLRALVRDVRPAAVVNAVGLLWDARLDPERLDAVNARFPRRLAQAACDVRLVHLGSVYEYGDQPGGTTVTEATAEAPVTPYAVSKLAGSRAVRAAGGTVLRVTTAVGAGAPRRSFLGGLAARLADGAHGDLEVPLAPGERDFVDVRDVADAVCAAVAAPGTGVLNVGSGRPVSAATLVDLLVRASGAPGRVVPVRAATGVRGGGDRQLVSVAAAREALGWSPRRTPADAVAALWTELAQQAEQAQWTSRAPLRT